MKVIHNTIEQELIMTYCPILGSKYELKNVIRKNTNNNSLYGGNDMIYDSSLTIIIEQECKHPKSAMIEVGYRILCGVCGKFMRSNNFRP